MYKHETAKQEFQFSCSFHLKCIILCPEIVSRNLPVPEISQIHLKTYQIDIKNLIRQKMRNFIRPFFKKKHMKQLKKGLKLQIWPQKSQTGNPA